MADARPTAAAAPRPRMMPFKAARSLIRILRDKENTREVFRFARYVDAPITAKQAAQFIDTPVGARVLSGEADLTKTLSDRDRLAELPTDSLGRAYLSFVTSEGLSAEGFQRDLEASGGRYGVEDGPAAAYARRVTHTHDLFHVVTGYGRDMIGELSLLAFTQRQTKSRAIGVLRFFNAFKAMRLFPGLPAWTCMAEGAQLGQAARDLVSADWEGLLERPLSEVRATLNVRAPSRYLAIKSRAEAIDLHHRQARASVV